MVWWQIVVSVVAGLFILVVCSVMVYSIFDVGPSPLPPSELEDEEGEIEGRGQDVAQSG